MYLRHPIVVLSAMVVVRLLAMFVLLKLLSSMFGPERFGTITQVMGVAAIFYMFAGGGISNGLIRSIAGARDQVERSQWLGASMIIVAAGSILLFALAATFYLTSGALLFGDAKLAYLFILIGIVQTVVGVGNIALAYLSGAGELKRFAFAHVIGSLFALALTYMLLNIADYNGALIGAALLPLGPALFGIFFLSSKLSSWKRPQAAQIVYLLQFGCVMAIGIAAAPFAHLFVRADMGRVFGWDSVGYWQAVARLSDAYMQVFGVLFVNFLLPRIAAVRSDLHQKILLKNGLIFVGLFLSGASVLWTFKETIIKLVFSGEFIAAVDYVYLQLIGDFCKVSSGVFIYYFVARGRLIVQGATELFQAFLFVVIFLLLKMSVGPEAAVIGHAVASATVLVFASLLYVFRSRLLGMQS